MQGTLQKFGDLLLGVAQPQVLHGVRIDDVQIDCPPPGASGEQWLDFAALVGFVSSQCSDQSWRKCVVEAYLTKYGGQHDSMALGIPPRL